MPQQEETIEFARMINNQFVIGYVHHAHNILKLYNLDGTFDKEVNLPDMGTVQMDFSGIPGRREDTEMFFPFQSFLYPPCIFHYDFKTGTMKKFFESEVNFSPSRYETKQVFYSSKDGTKIPMFIIHKKGVKLDGNNPVLLGGYGGFNISLTPGFNVMRLVWLEHGGISAVANLRGGGEYGEEWHREGMLEKKQNVFDDFIAAAEYLIENKYTHSAKLAIAGGSNGGLLVSACMVQRPSLFGAVICSVPLTDMLRYHKFTVGHRWIPEYGNPEENPKHFKFIHAYSPLHNIKESVNYPPLLIVTADTDDRVVPGHAKKFMATLQEKSNGKARAFIRIETKAGHGQGKPTSKLIDEQSDIYAFLFNIFNLEWKEKNIEIRI
ncbi:MAG: Prolyl endopeptidase [bacterium ADurb.Bin363]|nr:MAG: Prolyl endopeptidase [bacterium ADurb.Bin363]